MADIKALLEKHLRKQPILGEGVYLAKGAVVIGDINMGRESSIWYNAVARGDINSIKIGEYSNIQDNSLIHVADECPCIIGDWVTIGHTAIIHACTIGNECLIGMGATILDGAEIGDQSIIGANALVTGDTKIPPGSMVVGSPAKVKRALTDEERRGLREWAEKYVINAAYCLNNEIGVHQPVPTT
ncbi:MAG: Acyl-[acyl-carrier-protein]--UDP-N-acetylglucosamine O-acyltransferase [Verrucomicrobia subdivision 3 bacterium]|nr:Acyl-[acyl-carrier-protein]--UDP-N-acetylglucosamine O-acyltransferase [Limisphaerales bacterium]MCS1417496.1 Acyl-[acyl-carrier-protein]--UDP-N-acetylglucosamine O-acyltransferase [Limisphaerales bacterium]